MRWRSGYLASRLGGILRYMAALLALVLLSACGGDAGGGIQDPFDLPAGPSHRDLVRAAQAAGFKCSGPNPHGGTSCGDLLIAEGNAPFAEEQYMTDCVEATGPVRYVMWYEDSDWILWVLESRVTAQGVREIS
jgi:hypothetical protein